MTEGVERPEHHGLAAILLGAGDVGDRGDVVPVDAMAEAEPERRHEQSKAEATLREGRDQRHRPADSTRFPQRVATEANCNKRGAAREGQLDSRRSFFWHWAQSPEIAK